MRLTREYNYDHQKRDFIVRIESYCDSCGKTYWSNREGAVQDYLIQPGNYEYIVSVCPDCISKYDIEMRFAILNDTLDILIKNREKFAGNY